MKPKKIISTTLKMLLMLTSITLLAASVCGCEKNMAFEDEAALKMHVIGTWTSVDDDSTYYVFTDDAYYVYSFDTEKINALLDETFDNMKDNGFSVESIKYDYFSQKFHDAWLDGVRAASVTWDYEKGTVSAGSSTFDVSENGELKNRSAKTVLTKISDSTEEYEEKWNAVCEAFSERYYEKQTKYRFEKSYGDLPSATEVQYDKLGHVGRQFIITGTAELDDYYNWGYRDLEGLYFCIRIRPKGGNLSNEWYVYGSRTTHKDLYDKLMSHPGASVTLVCTLFFYDTGSNNMATLFDYKVN